MVLRSELNFIKERRYIYFFFSTLVPWYRYTVSAWSVPASAEKGIISIKPSTSMNTHRPQLHHRETPIFFYFLFF